MKLLKALSESSVAESLMKSGFTIVKNQPVAAPIFAGSSVAAALGMILVGGYGVFDCVRFQTKHGQCDESIRQDGGMLGAGVMMLLGNWGFFNTYNKKLHAEDTVFNSSDSRELVEDFPIAPVFNTKLTKQEILEYMASGATERDAARFFGVSRHEIRKKLDKQPDQKADRGR